MELGNKKTVVVGLGQSGIAAAEVLLRSGASVVALDGKDASELSPEVENLRALGAEIIAPANDCDLTGVDFVVTSPGVPGSLPVFERAREAGIEVMAEIELAYRIAKAPILAVTGTNGKTTTTILLGAMTKAGGRKTYVAGNVCAGDIKMPLITAAYKAGPRDVIAAEISSFQLETVKTFRPRISLFLNLTCDHMNRHSGMEEYGALKSRIFENQREFDFAVLNGDNEYTASVIDKPACQVLVFSREKELEEGAYIEGGYVCVRLDGRKHIICAASEIPLPGDHNVENVLAASAAAVAFGISDEAVKKAIVSFKPVRHRMEPIATINGVEYINNSMCTNVDAAVRSTLAIKKPQIIIAGGKDKGSDFMPLGETFAKKAKYVVLIGADAGIIEKAVQAAGCSDIAHAETLPEAVKTASKIAEEGDVVILTPACASFDMFSSFEDRGDTFRKAVKDLAGGRL